MAGETANVRGPSEREHLIIRRVAEGCKNREIADSLGLDRPNGAIISDVIDKSPAAEAGLKRNDVVLALDGQKIDDVEAFGYRFGTRAIGGVSNISVLRAGKPVALTLQLIGAPEIPPRDTRKLGGKQPFAGASVANVSPAVTEELALGSAGTIDFTGASAAMLTAANFKIG